MKDPDPSTYDQKLLLSSGGSPSFNSPDIDTIDVWPLRASVNITATIRNLSMDASANQTRVDVSWSEWGIGLPRQTIGSSFVDLARAGQAGSEQTLSWPRPALIASGSLYGFFVKVMHPYDRDTTNNEGEQTLAGFQTSTGRTQTYALPVRNPTSSVQQIDLTAGPAPIAAWIDISPASVTLPAGGQQTVSITIAVPAAIPAAPPGTFVSAVADVLATIGGAYLGGVSFLILIDA